MMNEEGRLLNENAVEDAVLEYFNENPEMLAGIAPERDLWPDIESRIGARVLPMHGATQTTRTGISRWRFRTYMAAAAAALVIATAGVTYMLARPEGGVPAVVAPPQVASGIVFESAHDTPDSATTEQQPDARAARDTGIPVTTHRAQSSSRFASRAPAAATVPTYDDEITTLRNAVEARRSQLDPATVTTIERNLRVIDNAIAQSRAALSKDPANRFLQDQLGRTLTKKTELLRTAALLPSA
jgi:hypothetical protein